jgi:hypothetical protein
MWQFSTTPTIPGYFGTAFAYPMEGSLMPTLTIDVSFLLICIVLIKKQATHKLHEIGYFNLLKHSSTYN